MYLPPFYLSRWLCTQNVETYPHTRNIPERIAKISKCTVSDSTSVKVLNVTKS
jgi:hypothetical protein